MLRNYGMPDERIDAPTESDPQWDSEALWHRVKFRLIRGARALPVLIVRGSDASGTDAGRPWLAQKLAEKGVVTNFTVAYERHLPTWSLEQGALALKARADGSVWVFSSSESIANLQHLLRDMAYFGAARALTTHPRIAEVARAAGFGEVLESHPAQQHVVQSLKSCL
jgi:uroporphyrinogen-III synthase